MRRIDHCHCKKQRGGPMGVAENKKSSYYPGKEVFISPLRSCGSGEIGIHARFRIWYPEGVGVRVPPLAPTHLSEIPPSDLFHSSSACSLRRSRASASCAGSGASFPLSIPPQLAASGGRPKPRKLKAASVTVRSSW